MKIHPNRTNPILEQVDPRIATGQPHTTEQLDPSQRNSLTPGFGPIPKSLDLIIDVPDREEHFENLSIPIGGLRLPIKTPNYYTTAVRIDAVQANKDIYRTVVTEKNPCIVRLVDINNNYMAGTVDVTWQGFSKEVI